MEDDLMNGMTNLEQNLRALSVRYPELAVEVRATGLNDDYRLVRSETGRHNVMVRRGSGWLHLYDNSSPTEYARLYLEDMRLLHAPYVVFMGLGLGYHLAEFLRGFSRDLDTKEVIIFEKDIQLFRLALEVGDFHDILASPHIHFFVGLADPEESFVKLRTDIFIRDYYRLRSVKIMPLPANLALDREYYLGAVETVKKALIDIMCTVGNDPFDSLVGLENILANLETIISNPGINDLSGKFRGKPGVLVAAGPSLNKNIHLLKGIGDKALVLACDSSLKPMLAREIRPHLVTSIERIGGTELYYSGIEDFGGIYFVALPLLMPETIELYKGRKFIAYRKYSHFDWLGIEKGSLNCGFSVANLAFKILTELGCDPIILIGQDLSYGEEGDTHAQGNVFGTKDKRMDKKPVVWLAGNKGRPVKSEKQWEYMKLRYEQDLQEYYGTCINATEGGARIRGTEVMTLSEAIQKHCHEPFHPHTILDDTYDGYPHRTDLEGALAGIHRKILDTRALVEETIADFRQATSDAVRAEEEIIRPFLAGERQLPEDISELLAVEQKWLDLSNTVVSDQTLHDILVQTIQPHDIWLANELAFLKDVYRDPKVLSMARVKKMREWFAVIGAMLVFTRSVLDTAMERQGIGDGSRDPAVSQRETIGGGLAASA